jgi:fatty acid desaturase
VFKYSQDRLPVSLILLLSAVDVAAYVWMDNVWALCSYWWIMLIPKLNICAWNHHHQHTNTFRAKRLNRMLEFFYALHTGVTTHLWVLHHVLGHHHHYLDQGRDESRWKRKDGLTMGELEYSIKVAAAAYYRGYQVGKKHPKIQKEFLFYSALTAMMVSALAWFRPQQAFFLFVLPMIFGLWLTSWVTYEHHAGLDTQNEYEASYNNLHRWYNRLTGNLGYHTAHHVKQGLHWSKLPILHEEIKHRIPSALNKSAWT